MTSMDASHRCALSLLVALGAAAMARESSLVDAVKSGDTAAVRALLAQKVDVNAAERRRHHGAALGGAPRRSRDDRCCCFAPAPRSKATNRYGVTPLQLACDQRQRRDGRAAAEGGRRSQRRAARRRDGADDGGAHRQRGRGESARGAVAPTSTRGKRSKGQTALMWAAAENNAAVVKLLVEPAPIRSERSKGGSFTPYLFAVRGGHIDASRALLDAGVDVEREPARRHERARAGGDQRALRARGVSSRKGANPNADAQGWTALHQIAWSRRHNAGFNLPGPVATGGVDSLELVRKLVQRAPTSTRGRRRSRGTATATC